MRKKKNMYQMNCINCNKLCDYPNYLCDECYESESEKPNDDFDP